MVKVCRRLLSIWLTIATGGRRGGPDPLGLGLEGAGSGPCFQKQAIVGPIASA